MTIQTDKQRIVLGEAQRKRTRIRTKLAIRLKALRSAAGVSQIEAASAGGITQASLSNYENDKREPPWSVVTLLMAFYADR